MKHILLLGICFVFQILCCAQTIENPIFERADVPHFRVKRVEVRPDTTYVYCIYHAGEHSWASLSDKTYLENVNNGTKYPIINISGIPFSPQQRNFTEAEDIQVILFFPHISADRINIIENDDNESFNIYGIDLKNSYDQAYSDADIESFYNSAMECEKSENWNGAINYLLKQLEASKFVYGIQSKEVAWPMYSLTMQYAGLDNWEKVIEWGKQAIEILKVLSSDSLNLDVLARAYGNVATAYHMLKEPDTAYDYMELSLAIRRLNDGVGAFNYEEYLSLMAKNYYYEENYPKALLYGKEIVDIYAQKYSENPYKYECAYIISLNNLCEFYQRMGQFDNASIVGKQAVDLINKGNCDDVSWVKYAVYNNLAAALSMIGNVDEGLSYLKHILATPDSLKNGYHGLISTKMLYANILLDVKRDSIEAINNYESVLKTLEDSMAIGKRSYYDYSEILHKLYKVQIHKDRNLGLNYLKKNIQVQKEWHGEESLSYVNSLIELINETFVESIVEGNTDTLYYNLRKTTEIIKRHINNTILGMTKMERKAYWDRYKTIFTWLIPLVSDILENDEWSSLAYDAALFYKGMLLASETEFKDIVYSSNDKTLQKLYSDYIRCLTDFERINTSGGTQSNLDSLKSVLREKEDQLSQSVSKFNKQCFKISYSWKDIRDKLGDNDVAIEIISFVGRESKTEYDAYVITNKSKAPRLIPLFKDITLSSQFKSGNIDYQKLSSLIWGNDSLLEIIGNRSNIYFSTSGLLNIVGIEYLPISENLYANEKYNLFRVSSTRELCMSDETTIKTSCLFGGLDYNKSSAFANDRVANDSLSQSVRSALLFRGDFEPLPGSEKEIEQIGHEMTNKEIRCTFFKGTMGTEESFKNLSGSQISIIHLSTHGMYIPDDNIQLKEKSSYQFIVPDEKSNIGEEEKSLSRSFMVMSGGNALIHRDSISVNEEDGILTALEISHLDFSFLDLVVLSACETALGKVDTEGVYGLQRGFKKAGANSILMSLNKVDDEATRILMVEFYRNLMSGKTKRQSLFEAQQYLRKVDNRKYDDPKYWASFIMLDGLN